MSYELRQPVTGAELLLAAAAGDALGAATEFMTSEEALEVYPHRPASYAQARWRDMLPGDATDDTQLAICTVQALVQADVAFSGGAQVVNSIRSSFASWLESSPPDAGSTLQRALQIGSMETWAQYGQSSATNGALMRAHAVSALDPMCFDELVRLSVLSSASTHAAPESIWSCLYTNILISQLQEGNRWSDVIWHALDTIQQRNTECLVFEALADGFSSAGVLGHWQAMCTTLPHVIESVEAGALGVVGNQEGSALSTLQAAIAHNINGSDHLDITWRAAIGGNDTDTVASVAGAIAAARGLMPSDSMIPQLRAGHSWGAGLPGDGWRSDWSLVDRLCTTLA